MIPLWSNLEMGMFKNRIFDGKRRSIFVLFGMGVSILSFVGAGCSGERSKPYDRSLVVTYAELTHLYEKEKMTNKTVDSLYQVKVKDFFTSRGLQQEKFKEVIDGLSKHRETWQLFIQDVTKTLDSLRAVRK